MTDFGSSGQLLREKIDGRQARVGLIGLGYVGLPLALLCVRRGFTVVGFDTDPRKVAMLQAGESYINHISSQQLRDLPMEVTGDPEQLRTADVVILCVPTPLGNHREPNLSYVLNSTRSVATILRPGQLVILESTTYPGTTTEEVLPVLQETGLQVGVEFFLGYSPEREDPGNPRFQTSQIPKVVSGITQECTDIIRAFYDTLVVKTVPVSSTRVAEATKILENTYRCVNIALVNELKILFQRMGIDIWEVIEAASTKPFGFQPFYPGPGLGGHCIPIDPFYLTWKAHEYGLHTRFIELAGEINTAMPFYVLDQLIQGLNRHGKAPTNCQVLLLGVAYKPNIGDPRESPALKLIDLLQTMGTQVLYHDPLIPTCRGHSRYPHVDLESVELTREVLCQSDAVVVVTDHDQVNYELVAAYSPLVVDTRNALARRGLQAAHVIKA